MLDEDLEGYDTSLLYITKKNPRGLTYADMKLYLRMQVGTAVNESTFYFNPNFLVY